MDRTYSHWSKRRKTGTYIALLSLFILLVVSFVGTAHAQTSIQVDVHCAGDMVEGLPPNFDGTIYRVRTPYQGYTTWQLEAISATGMQVTDIPVPGALFEAITPVEVSPDGQYVLFEPVRVGTSIAVWDILSNEFITLVLPEETVSYLGSNPDPNWRQQRKTDWISPDQFVIRFFDLENNFFLNQLAEQVFTVTQNPLTIVTEPQQIIDYPPLPFPETASRDTRSFSPQRSYVQALYEQNIVGSRNTRFRFQIYNTQPLELVADFNSSETFNLVAEPFWSDDERVLFLEYYTADSRKLITEIDVGIGFQEAQSLLDTLHQTFGSEFSLYGLRPAVDHNSSRLLFTATASDHSLYTVVYDYDARTLKAVCRGTAIGGNTITGSHSYPVWSPDEDIIGFYDVGNLFLLDTVTGQSYYEDALSFVGWVDTSIPLETPTADAGPDQTLTDSDTPARNW